MEERFMEVMADMFGEDTGSLSMDLEYKKYGKWDSLKMMNIIMELEDAFNISIPIERISSVRTLRDLYAIIEER